MFPPCLRGELEKQRTAVFLPFTPVAASAARGEAEISCHIFVAKQKYPTPDEKSGVRYEQTYSTVPPCLRSQRSAARVLCNGRSRPSLHIGGRLQGGGCVPGSGRVRFQPAAVPLCCRVPDSVLFNAFFSKNKYITGLFPCQVGEPAFFRTSVPSVFTGRARGCPGPPVCRTAAPLPPVAGSAPGST